MLGGEVGLHQVLVHGVCMKCPEYVLSHVIWLEMVLVCK